MLIDLTVRNHHDDHDLRLDAPAPTPFGAVRTALLRACGLPEDCRLYLDDTELQDAMLLAETGLRTGAVLRTAAVPAACGPAYSLRVTGGPAAGA
ncbi:hypothetical protein, partial [uncultured Jatrophihabitans sp.]|uniref:hypothetical protein n=1 Tax=uncultured Jatrophihabitans sp. TaxID=1610747 RepID=UPI0035CAB7DB